MSTHYRKGGTPDVSGAAILLIGHIRRHLTVVPREAPHITGNAFGQTLLHGTAALAELQQRNAEMTKKKRER